MSQSTRLTQVIEIVKKAGILRPKELEEAGFSRTYLIRLYEKGLLDRPARGIYTVPDVDLSQYQSLAEASKKVPRGVICLLSALSFHGIGTQSPFEVWLAIGSKAQRPRDYGLRLRIVRFSDRTLTEGVEEHMVEGVNIRIFSPAKSVADCFKFRNKIGLDVALEALRDCVNKRLCTKDELWMYAKLCRVSNVMRPYLEAIS